MKNFKALLFFTLVAVAFSSGTVYFLNKKKLENTLQLAEPPTGGDFSLNSVNGTVNLKDFRGKYVFLYFGYTFCPDVCPTSLSALAATLNRLTPQELENVEVLFVSVDPNRDTVERLKEYSSFFHPKFKGLTGSEEELRKVIKLYGGAYKINPPKEGGPHYTVDHSADLYLIGPDGAWLDTIKHGTPATEMQQKLYEYFNKAQIKK